MTDRADRWRSPQFRPWWKAQDGQVARDLYAQANKLELQTAYWKARAATLYKLVNGEDPPVSFGYWLTRRAANVIGSLDTIYRRPYVNIISEGVSFLENRIGTTHAIVELSPNDTTFKVRKACRDVTTAVDALFDQLDVYPTQRLTYRDRNTWGMSYVKVTPNSDRDGVEVSRRLPVNFLVDNANQGKNHEMIEICFISREELWDHFGGIDEKTDAAIRNAPLAFNQTGGGPVSEVCVLLEAYHTPTSKKDKGRHALCLPNHDLVDEEWNKPFPYVVQRAKPQSVGFYANGPAFDAAPYQKKINELVSRIDEGQDAAHGYWRVDSGTKLQAKNLGARPRAVIEQEGGRPADYYTPQAVQPELYSDLDRWIAMGVRHAFGLSPDQAAGEKPAGVTSGRGLRFAVSIEDSRHKADTIGIEEEAKSIAERIIAVAEEINLQVTTSGIDARTLKWSDIGIKRNSVNVQTFPISSLPSEPLGRANEIDDRYANGVIDIRTYRRLLSWGDLRATDNYANAAQDLVEATLDEICERQKFIAPELFEDPQLALTTAKARYALEKRFKAPRKTLRALRQYMAVAADLIANPQGQQLSGGGTSVPASPPAAMGPPARNGIGEPAPAPVQVAPPMAAPPALAA